MGKSVCIIDFAGNDKQNGYWAGWKEAEGLVYFGGAWLSCQPMPSIEEPLEDEVYKWAVSHKLDTLVTEDGKTYKLGQGCWELVEN